METRISIGGRGKLGNEVRPVQRGSEVLKAEHLGPLFGMRLVGHVNSHMVNTAGKPLKSPIRDESDS